MTRSILITGCSSGIGYDAAHGLRDRGWRVFASCRQAADCERLRGEGFESPRIDHEDPASIVEGLTEVFEATDGTLDALFNNGAWGMPALVEDTPREAMEAIFSANLFGVHDLTRRVIPVMRRQGHGRIVNNSSVLGLVGVPFRGPYVATKFALEGLTDTLRMEMRGTGIHVVLIEPGPIGTAFRRNAALRYERWIDPASSARADDYRFRVEKRLYAPDGPDRFELPPSAVTAKLVRALDARRPKARYFVTTPTYIAGYLRHILPTWAADSLLARQ